MTRLTRFLALAAVATVAPCTFAQKHLVLNGSSHRVKPLFAQKIIKTYTENGHYRLVLGKKINLQEGDIFPTVATNTAFDCFEWDASQFPNAIVPGDNPAYGGACGVSGPDRWFLGDTYSSGVNSYNDMTVVNGSAGKLCSRAAFAWNIATDGIHSRSLTNMAVIVGTCEAYDLATPGGLFDNGANGRGDLDRYLIQYGAYTQDPVNGGYVYDDVQFANQSDGWHMPADGLGGYYVSVGDYDAGTNTWTSDVAQNMLWGTYSPAQGSQDLTQFDDDYPADGSWDPANENYTYDYDVCPDPLGSMACFLWENAASPVTLTPTSFTVGLGAVASGNLASLAADDANALKICKAFVPNFTSPRIRLDATYLSPYLTATSVQLDMKARMTTGGAFNVRGFLADTSGSGSFAYGGANQVIADSTINLSFASYSSGAVASGNHIDTDSDATPDGTIVARTEIQQTGFSAVAVPCAEWEFMTVTVTP